MLTYYHVKSVESLSQKTKVIKSRDFKFYGIRLWTNILR